MIDSRSEHQRKRHWERYTFRDSHVIPYTLESRFNANYRVGPIDMRSPYRPLFPVIPFATPLNKRTERDLRLAYETRCARRRTKSGAINTIEFSRILIEAAEEEGRADVWLLDREGGPLALIGNLGIPGGGQDTSGTNLRADPVWNRLMERLTHIADGSLQIETCFGSCWVQQEF